MAGFDRGMVFREVEPYLSDEDLAGVFEQERQEKEGNIPKHDHLGELYGEFERENLRHIQVLTELIGIEVALAEGAEPDMEGIIRELIAGDLNTIETIRKDIRHGRKTVTELKRLQR